MPIPIKMKTIKLLIPIMCCFIALSSCQNSKANKSKTKSLSLTSVEHIEQKVDALLKQMTLEEKIGQMNQYAHFSRFLALTAGEH